MTCKDAADLIEPIAAGDLEPSDEIRAHFETCPSCAGALAMARRLELALAADRPPAPPEKFVPAVLQRVRRDRWRMEQNVDRLFNVAIVLAFVIVAIGALALMNLSGVLAAAAGASSALSELSGQLARQMEPALNTYIAAAGLLLTALGMWWWAERRASF
jgi:hypothetical protein